MQTSAEPIGGKAMTTRAELGATCAMLRKLLRDKLVSNEECAEKMGYDAGRNGPNTENCHFSLFATPALTAAWERGKKRAEAESSAALHSSSSTKEK
jgi:ribosome modulation factor